MVRSMASIPVLSVCCVSLQLGCVADAGDEAVPHYAKPRYVVESRSGRSTRLRFADITVEAGIDFNHITGAFGAKWMPETMGSGGGFLDFDGDGWLDVFLVNGTAWPGHGTPGRASTPHLYRNLEGSRFSDVTDEVGLAISIYGMGAAFADYDGDGDTDIYVTAVGDNKLFRNDGGIYRDVTKETRVTGNSVGSSDSPAWSTAAAWLDYDRDGFIDLFVCNYVKWTPETDLFTTLDGESKSYATPEQYQGDSCRLYRNTGGRRFDDVTAAAGVYDPSGKSLGIAVTDIDADGWPDLFVANDTERNFLFRNNRDGTFTDVAVQAGVGYDEFGRARAGMGVDAGDVFGEGKISIAIGNFSQEPLSLYTEIGESLFQDAAGRAGLTRASLLKLTFGLVFVDLDLDGWLDIVTANGHIEPAIGSVQQSVSFAQQPQAFLNLRNGRFADVSELMGAAFNEPIVGRGVAYGDIDRDGDLDLLITVNGGRPKLLRNDLPDGAAHRLALELYGKGPNRDALGAVVTVFSDGMLQRRMVRTGSSYLSQSDARTLVFGLGGSSVVDSITVHWPTTGQETKIGMTSAGWRYSVDEGSGTIEAVSVIGRRERR